MRLLLRRGRWFVGWEWADMWVGWFWSRSTRTLYFSATGWLVFGFGPLKERARPPEIPTGAL